ncbi:MAG: amino acid adenylation domain-containing protein [Terracidiphilus sp.]
MIPDLRVRIAGFAKHSPHSLALLACSRKPANYENLLNQMDQTAKWLAIKSIGRADRVAVVMPNGPEMASLFLGIASVSACAPLNPAYKASEFEFYLSDLKPKLVIVDAAMESAVCGVAHEMDIEVVSLRRRELGEAGSFELGPEAGQTIPNVTVDYAMADDVALVLHTSGTTSRPKIVPLTHENLCVSAVNIATSLALTVSDRCLNIMPLFHVHGLVGAVLSSLCAGASVVCTPGYKVTEFYDWLAEFRPTWYTGVPTMHHGLLTRAEVNRAIIAANPLRFIRSCSSALEPKIMAQLEETFGAPVLEAYGMTEAAHQMSCSGLPPWPRKPGSVGRPTGVEVAIMNEAGALLQIGTEGEVVIRGRNVTRGYENNPDANLKSFTDGWFRTGDQGRFDDDGDLFLTGRIKELIVRGGEKIPPREIDEVLLAHPAVEQALGFALPDVALGERVAAAVVLKAGASVTELELCEHAAGSLADFKVPERIIFVTELPKGPTGKPQRIGLAEKLGLSGLAEPPIAHNTEYCAPRNDIETRLAEMWRAALKLERTGIHDNFFDAGGDSILASQLVSRIRSTFCVELSVPGIFQLRTIAKLGEIIEGHWNGKASNFDLPSISRKDGVLLTSAQQRMWFLSQLEPEIPVYNRPFAYRLKGSLDLFRLQQSLSVVAQRHEILRTNYLECDGVVKGFVRDANPISVALVDLSGLPTAQVDSSLVAWMRQESARSFNLATDPVLRCSLARLAPDENVLLFVMHHIAYDASTEVVILQDLAGAYNGTLSNAACAQYADYAAWQDSRQAVARDEELAWWKQQLAGMDAPSEVPSDFVRPRSNRYKSSSVPLQLNAGTFERCKALARTANTTVFTVLLAAFDALLQRYTGTEDIVVGTPVAVRNHPAAESMVGLFINTLALRTSAAGNPSFCEFMERVRETVVGAIAHQEVPFEAIVNVLRTARNAERTALFQVMFEYRNIEKPHLAMEGVDAERIKFDRGFMPFDFTLDIEPGEGGLRGSFYYNTGLFEHSTIERMSRHFETLLGDAIQSPDKKLSQLQLSTVEEQAQVLTWGRNTTHYPDACVHELFEQQAGKTPNAVAVVFKNASLSYSELNRRANQLAHYLRELGIRPDARVAICVERGVTMIVALLGVLKAGGAYVPLDPGYPVERLRFMLDDCAPVALLTHSYLEGLFSGIRGRPSVLDLAAAVPAWNSQPETNPDPYAIGLKPEHLAYVLYTSGSTGNPKGVMVEHRNLSNYLSWANDAYYRQEGSGSPSIHSISFDGLVTTLFCPILTGQTLTLLPEGTEIDSIVQACLSDSLPYTLIKLTPSHLKLLNRIIPPDVSKSPARALMIGGEPIVAADVLFWQKRFPELRLINHFGPTETTVGCCTFDISEPLTELSLIPIGRPIANTRIYILDGNGQPVPVGEPGELYIGGAGVARGYLNQPEQTAEKFMQDPFVDVPGARMYRTGDLGRWLADGNIKFLGRNDFQVKIRGFRIELGEIESRLMEHPAVREAVVLASEDTPGDKRLIAYYTSSRKEPAAGAEELRSHLSASLPEYMVPAAYVRLDALPLTPNGKLDRKALPAPEAGAYSTRSYEPPRSEIETKLAAIWAETLNLEHIGKRDNYFDLGGNSLLIVKLLSRVEHSLGIRVPVATLFQHSTLQAFSDAVAKRIETTAPQSGVRPLGPLLWINGGVHFRNISAKVRPVSEVLPIWLQAEAWESFRPPFSLESVARILVGIIRDRYSEGPYMIGGNCQDGVLAYETAQQLLALGCDVALLVLVESETTTNRTKLPLIKRLRVRLALERYYFRKIARASLKEWVSHLGQRLSSLFLWLRSGNELPTDVYWLKKALDHGYRRFLSYLIRHYEARPYNAHFAFFQAKDRLPVFRVPDPSVEWRSRVGQDAEFHVIPGDHQSMFRAPNIEVLADQLRQTIDKVAAERSRDIDAGKTR